MQYQLDLFMFDNQGLILYNVEEMIEGTENENVSVLLNRQKKLEGVGLANCPFWVGRSNSRKCLCHPYE